MFARFVVVVALVAGPALPAVAADSPNARLVARAGVRPEPDAKAKVMGWLDAGKTVQVGSKRGEWQQVRFRVSVKGETRTIVGWIPTSTIDAPGRNSRPSPAPTTPPSTPATGESSSRLTAQAGVVSISHAYTFESASVNASTSGQTIYSGPSAQLRADLHRYVGLDASLARAWGKRSGTVAPLQQRYLGLGSTITSGRVSVYGRLPIRLLEVRAHAGYRYLGFQIDQVLTPGDPIPRFLTSNTYEGPIGGVGLRVGTENWSATARGDYWFQPGLSEGVVVNATGGGPSGRVDRVGAWSARLELAHGTPGKGFGLSAWAEITQLNATFSGPGKRFGQPVNGAATREQYLGGGLYLTYHR